jgi:two-component system, NtrC family, response regulator PilR
VAQPTVLIVDDEPDIRELLSMTLESMEISPDTAADVAEARRKLQTAEFHFCLTDMRLPDGDGLELVQWMQRHAPGVPVAVITAHGNVETAVRALKLGAFDFVSKPVRVKDLRKLVSTALKLRGATPDQPDGSDRLLGSSPAMERVRAMIAKVARSQAPVHIVGDSGTGKELVARLIHDSGPRAGMPFVAINCGAIPTELMESELFGHQKGSFTGATTDKEGLIRSAEGGTVLLDEIAELPLLMQVKLLRVIQERTFIPLGATEEVNADVRIIAATNRPVESEVSEGKFREDLFYRLSGVIVHLPPLRERGQDILMLADHFLMRASRDQKRDIRGFVPEAREKMARYHYPGNVRELENILERAVALEPSDLVTPASLIIYEQHQPQSGGSPEYFQVLNGQMSLDEYLDKVESQILEAALERTGGHKGKAAELVGLNFRQFRYRLSKFQPQDETDDMDQDV